MTEPRGRALILSNMYQVTDEQTENDLMRHGLEHDYKNMKRVLDSLSFVTAGEHKNYNAKV